MKKQLINLVLLGCCLTTVVSAPAAGKIRIVTTIPDLADFARAIGGDLVEVDSLATGVEDPHGIPMKPSFVTRLNRADLVILLGLDNEHSYLPALLDAAKNPRIMAGKPGYIDTSKGIVPLDVPASIDKSAGDVHPAGNPHYNLDPGLAKTIVTNIYDGLVRNYPQYEAKFRAGRDAYLARLDAKIPQWEALAKTAPGLQFVSYHSHWPYFSHRFGFKPMGTIEFRPGIEPTARHISDLITMMKADGIKVVVREPQFSEKVPKQIAAQTGARIAKLAIMVGGVPEAKTYFDLIDYNLRTLLNAAK